MKIPKGPGRNPFKRDLIVNYVKDHIIGGTWKPGERVPARTFLERRFAASSVTVQQSLDLLNKDGFVRVEGRLGTFVNEKLPHQNNYGLVFPDRPSKTVERNAYFAIMDSESKKLQQSVSGKIIKYYDIDQTRGASFYKLIEDIQERRLAGLIFTTTPFMVEKTPILDLPGIPRVAFMTAVGTRKLPSISLDSTAFIDQSIDYLVSKGHKRIAFIDTPGFNIFPAFEKSIAKKGVCLPEWHQSAALESPESAGRIVRLLMAKFNTERPDGLIITNDNHTPYVQEALLEAGVKVPEELTLVSLTNFPSKIPKTTPVKLIGFNILESLKLAIRIIDDIRDGKKVPKHTKVYTESEKD